MRIAKSIILFLGICLILIFCGEESHTYVYGFLEENPFFFVDAKNKEMYETSFGIQLCNMAEQYQIGLYAQSACIGKDGIEEAHVYLNHRLSEQLKWKKQYLEGECPSLLLDTVRVYVHDFSEFAQGEWTIPDRVYLSGSIDEARAIRSAIVKDYNVSEVEQGVFYAETDVVIFLWLVVGLVFIFLTIIDAIVSRKRGLLRMVVGCGKYRQIIEGVVFDLFGVSVAFFFAYKLTGHWYVFYDIKIHILFGLLLWVASVMIHITVSKVDVQQALRQVQVDRGVLKALSCIKVLITAVSLLIIAGFINEIHKTSNIWDTIRSLEHLEDDYYFICFYSINIEENNEAYINLVNDFFRGKEREYQPIYVSERGYSSSEDEKLRMVEISYDAHQLFGLTSVQEYDTDYVVQIPSKIYSSVEEVKNDLQLYEMILDACGYETVVFEFYNADQEFVCTTGGEGRLNLKTCQNPIILLRTRPDTGMSLARVMKDFNEGTMKVMVRFSDQKALDSLYDFEDDWIKISADKVSSLLEEQKHKQEMFLFSEGVMCGMIFIYNILLSLRLTKIDFLVNKRKSAIGVILGKTLFERYRTTVLRYVLTTFVSLLLVMRLGILLGYSLFGPICILGIVICTVDILFYLLCMSVMEKKSIKTAITGGIYA